MPSNLGGMFVATITTSSAVATAAGKVLPSTIETPLAMIALFVVAIEGCLALLIPKVANSESQSRLIGFLLFFPTMIAFSFFVFLWKKPLHLYSPLGDPKLIEQLSTKKIERELLPDRTVIVAMETVIDELGGKIAYLERLVVTNRTRIGDVKLAAEDSKRFSQSVSSRIKELSEELASRVVLSGDLSQESIDSVANVLETEVEEAEKDRVMLVEKRRDQFVQWLKARGLNYVPSLRIQGNTLGEMEPVSMPTAVDSLYVSVELGLESRYDNDALYSLFEDHSYFLQVHLAATAFDSSDEYVEALTKFHSFHHGFISAVWEVYWSQSFLWVAEECKSFESPIGSPINELYNLRENDDYLCLGAEVFRELIKLVGVTSVVSGFDAVITSNRYIEDDKKSVNDEKFADVFVSGMLDGVDKKEVLEPQVRKILRYIKF